MGRAVNIQESDITVLTTDVTAEASLSSNWKWLLALGILCVLTGIVGVTVPFLTSVVTTQFIGGLFIVAGVLEMVHAFKSKMRGGFMWNFIGSLVTLVGGALLLTYPFAGMVVLTIFIAAVLLVRGIDRCVTAVRVKPTRGWGWLMISGILTTLFGAYIWLILPSAALWLLGLMVGIDLIFAGVIASSFALAVKDFQSRRQERPAA